MESASPLPIEIQDVANEYGQGAVASVWLDCAGKQAASFRPTIIMMDDGIIANAVNLKDMRESRCSFAILARR
jgi:hypothetical protein